MAESKTFTLAEVEQNSSPSKPLLIIDNAVYDVTEFLNEVRKSFPLKYRLFAVVN